MSLLTKDDHASLVSQYFEFPDRRTAILETYLSSLSSLIDEEIAHQKLTLSPYERYAEAAWAVIEEINSWDYNLSGSFEQGFLYHLRKALRQLKPRRDHVCVDGLSIEDPNSDPESIYIVKEQIELIKEFLVKKYGAVAVDQFMRRFADGQTYSEIATDYSVTTASLIPKLKRMLARVSKYMKRMNDG